jgi:hypothetical protein
MHASSTPIHVRKIQTSLSTVLEQEGERKVTELIRTNNVSEETLMGIINEGNDAFKSAHGRNMTYSEMRSLYG